MRAETLPVSGSMRVIVALPPENQTAPEPKAIAPPLACPGRSGGGVSAGAAIVRTTVPDSCSSSSTEALTLSPTHRRRAPNARPAGVAPMAKVLTSALDFASIMEIVCASRFSTHTLPPPTAMFVGPAPTGMTADMRFVSGSMTATELGTAASDADVVVSAGEWRRRPPRGGAQKECAPITIKRPPLRRTASGTRRGRAAGIELRVLPENGLLELLQLAARLEPELAVEIGPRLPVSLERIGLAAGAVQREHELRPQALAQRMLDHERFELRHELGMTAECEVGLDSSVPAPTSGAPPAGMISGWAKGSDAKSASGGPRHRASASPRATPAPSASPAGDQGPPTFEQPFEALRIELVRRQLEQVAAASRLEHAVADHLPQLRHVDLQALDRGGWRLLTPQPVYQTVGRDDLAPVQE